MRENIERGAVRMVENERQDLTGKQRDILELARKLFLSQGYYKTSIRQIARELDISLGLVAYYFPT